LDPVSDLDQYRRYLQWVFLNDCGRHPRADLPLLVVLPKPMTAKQHAAIRKAYLEATGQIIAIAAFNSNNR
jgi:hypothetical protein